MHTKQLAGIKSAIKLRYNTSEQTVLLPKYKQNNTPTKKYVLILSLGEDV